MAKTIGLAILLVAILCIVPGCGGGGAGDGSCDTLSGEKGRCLGNLGQYCRDASGAIADGPGTWVNHVECGADYQCTVRTLCDIRWESGLEVDCSASEGWSTLVPECVYVGPGGDTDVYVDPDVPLDVPPLRSDTQGYR